MDSTTKNPCVCCANCTCFCCTGKKTCEDKTDCCSTTCTCTCCKTTNCCKKYKSCCTADCECCKTTDCCKNCKNCDNGICCEQKEKSGFNSGELNKTCVCCCNNKEKSEKKECASCCKDLKNCNNCNSCKDGNCCVKSDGSITEKKQCVCTTDGAACCKKRD